MSWVSEFVRRSFLNEGRKGCVAAWSRLLVEFLEEAKLDQEVHVFGVSRIPKMPNYLLASSSEHLQTNEPVRIHLTEKTADVFLSPIATGIRLLQEEFPMIVYYEQADDPTRRHELVFYEAACFDGEDSSIVLGLVLNDMALRDYLQPEELAELLPIFRAQGLPLLELHLYKQAHSLLEEEARLMTGVMRDSNPDLLKILPTTSATEAIRAIDAEQSMESGFLQYATQQLRLSLDVTFEADSTGMTRSPSSGLVRKPENGLTRDRNWHETLLKSFANIVALLNPQVKPRVTAFSIPDLMRAISLSAHRLSTPHNVDIQIEEPVGEPIVTGDQATAIRLIERLLEYTFPFCRDGTCWIRGIERTENQYYVIEIEDSGDLPASPAPQMLLRNVAQYGASHPRLRNGGGILFRLAASFFERCGGRFHLSTGLNHGFAVQFVFPLLSSGKPQKPVKARKIGDTQFEVEGRKGE